MYNLRSRSKDRSKYLIKQKDVSMTPRSKSRFSDMNANYQSQKIKFNWVFTLKKIEVFTFERSDDSRDNLSSYLSEFQIHQLVIKISK